jgi:hypothetical protein
MRIARQCLERISAFILTIFAGGTYNAPVLQHALASPERCIYYGTTHYPHNSTLAKPAIHLEKIYYGQVA